MIDTRLKVDGKWNFKMDNVWFLFVMTICTIWCILEAILTYTGYYLTGELKIGLMFFINIMFMMIALVRRVVDKTTDKVKQLEQRVQDLESGK